MAIWLRFKAWIIAVAAAVGAVIGIYFYGRKSGAMQEAQRQRDDDLDKARSVQDAADKARDNRIDNPIDELRKHSRLRD